MTVELISVGTEILMGNILNSNARYLAEKCAMLGFNMYFQVTVGDNFGRLQSVIRTALDRSDLVILTGGLGPTEDDLTKEACAAVMGVPLVEDAHTKALIEAYFRNNIYREIPQNNWKMTTVPEGALVLDNHNGMAPGLIVEKNGKTAILLPGPPGELYPLFEEQVMPYLQKLRSCVLLSKTMKICGHGESQVESRLLDLIDAQTNPTIATYAKVGEVHVRLTASAADNESAEALLEPVAEEIRRRFGTSIYTEEEGVTLEAALVKLLTEKKLTISTAESCTGGMVSARLVNVPGASQVFMQGMATYSNEAKMRLLGVRQETLKEYGAVSAQTAREMAAGGAKAARTDVCVSITGLAGPGGGSPQKPVGLVFMACCLKGQVKAERWQFKGNREKIREQSVMKALDLVRRCVLEFSDGAAQQAAGEEAGL
ncbi:MAG TPA: competence/damage-inducible protein A [Candidatus Enterocloster faecavium]|uniref:Putative competence-damage inducible protein n=1 Tax=Candidatus Enterocloster faecavium TaxID=2838560 RepID=A0A9D2L5T0_9FIRM|nr:competence/damage-inducible protein A [Candidatus Enterocloster faecavium]